MKLHEILHIFKQIYRGQYKVSNKNGGWVWDPPWFSLLLGISKIEMFIHKYALIIIMRQFKEFEQSRQVLSLKHSCSTLSLTPCVKRPQLNGKCLWKRKASFNSSFIYLWSIWDASRKVKDISRPPQLWPVIISCVMSSMSVVRMLHFTKWILECFFFLEYNNSLVIRSISYEWFTWFR